MRYETVGIICAMPKEGDLLTERMTERSFEIISGIRFNTGLLMGKRVIVALDCVGKVSSAICAEIMILKYAPDVIINSGVAGTLTPGLGVGDVAVADRLVQHDVDTSPMGDPVGLISGINVIYLPTDPDVTTRLRSAVAEEGLRQMIGVIATGDQFIASPEKKKYISDTFFAIACEMEAAAIAQVCFVNEVPCGIIRAISDGEGAVMDYSSFVEMAARHAANVALRFLRDLDEEFRGKTAPTTY